VQLNPVVNNNVVTYNVVMEVANEPRAAYVPAQESEPASPKGLQGRGPGEHHRPDPAKGPRPAGSQFGTLEYTTARYMPPGSPVYTGNLALFPGMTANCTIITNRKEDTLRVPSSALRFNPAAFIPMEDKKARPAGAAPGGPAGSRGLIAKQDDRLWVLENGKPKPVPVRAGVSDGMYTQVTGDGVAEGMSVLTGVEDYKKPVASASGGPSLMGGGMRH
jgi:HlyD family secretion protein